MNKLLLLPGNDDKINEIITTNIEEIHELIKGEDMKINKEGILKRLERLNFLVSSPSQISILINNGFIFSLFQMLNIHLSEEEDNNTESFVNNEFWLVKTVIESISEGSSSLINVIKLANNRKPSNIFLKYYMKRLILEIYYVILYTVFT
jgi:hypothetical protein